MNALKGRLAYWMPVILGWLVGGGWYEHNRLFVEFGIGGSITVALVYLQRIADGAK